MDKVLQRMLTVNETRAWRDHGKRHQFEYDVMRYRIRKGMAEWAREDGAVGVEIVAFDGEVLEVFPVVDLQSNPSALPDELEGFDSEDDTPVRAITPRDAASLVLSSLQAGDVVRVGKTRWEIFRVTGVYVLATKAGTSGKKLYQISVSSFEPLEFEVSEIYGGSGQRKDAPPVAVGPLTEG